MQVDRVHTGCEAREASRNRLPTKGLAMPTARDIMTSGTDHLSVDTTAADAARRLADDSIGSVPVCNIDGHLLGVVSDRDLVIDVIAKGRNPESTKLGDLIQEEAVTIGADDTVEDAIQTMSKHKVRRLPVIDGDKLVGMVSQADIARACPPEQVGELVAAISD
jgi:CBS domain-containing protein